MPTTSPTAIKKIRETFFVFQQTGDQGEFSSKFWNIRMERTENDRIEIIREWGRLGTKKPGKKVTRHYTECEANTVYSDELYKREYERGYTSVPKEKFQALHIGAASLGKLSARFRMEWARMTREGVEIVDLHRFGETRSPDTPGIIMEYETKKSGIPTAVLFLADGPRLVRTRHHSGRIVAVEVGSLVDPESPEEALVQSLLAALIETGLL